MTSRQTGKLILLTGATGYLGGRLLRELQNAGRSIRCMARRPQFLKPRVQEATEVVYGDMLQPESLDAALQGVTSAVTLGALIQRRLPR